MYKEIIGEFKGLNLNDIYNVITLSRPEMKERFNNWEKDGKTRGFMLEYFVYFILNKVDLFNPMKKGADFIDDFEKFDMKCITIEKGKLLADTPISEFDYSDIENSNVMNKMEKLILPIIDRDHNIVDVKFFDIEPLYYDILLDWELIIDHIVNDCEGNVRNLTYLRCKSRGGKYNIFFNQTVKHNILVYSYSISKNNKVENPVEYINGLREKWGKKKLISYQDFEKMIKEGKLYELYDNFVG